jgi:hypothetical protein
LTVEVKYRNPKKRSKIMRRILLALMLVLMSTSLVCATPGISLKKATWNAVTTDENGDPETVGGYFLYWGDTNDTTTFNNTARVDCGNVLEYNLDSVTGKFVSITCYDVAGNEGGYSNVAPLDNIAPNTNSTLKVEKQSP